MSEKREGWIDDLEYEGANIKWAWSNFDGAKRGFNEEGDYNFKLIIPDEDVDRLRAEGWNVRENEPYEEGDPPEYLLDVKISDKFGLPPIYFLKSGNRKVLIEKIEDCKNIKRAMVDQVDVIIQPSRWVNGDRTGISAYVKEMYVQIKSSRFSDKYDDYEEI